MKLIPLLLCIVAAISVIFVAIKCRPSSSNEQIPDYCIRIILPLSTEITFDYNAFSVEYLQRWNDKIVCGSLEKDTGDTSIESKFAICDTNQNKIIWMTYSPQQLQPELTKLLTAASDAGFTDNEKLMDSDKTALLSNKASIELNYMLGEVTGKERAEFTAKSILLLSKLYPVIGYVDASAQSYRPVSKLMAFEGKSKLESSDLFLIFVNVQIVSGVSTTEIHTHGMDQFWLPDIQMIFKNKSDLNYNFDVLRNSAVYLLEKGNILKIGDTGELAGDGINYEVIKVKEVKDHSFGYYGAIGLKKL